MRKLFLLLFSLLLALPFIATTYNSEARASAVQDGQDERRVL